MKDKGIVYALTGEYERGRVQGYHQKPSPNLLSVGAKSSDIKNLKKKDKINIVKLTDHNGNEEHLSKFTIGFEIEKNSLHRHSVREYELFCGFERDGSCGYEAVTHILPLVGDSTWKTKVFDMMWKARRILDDTHSPSDKRCGGHITIAARDVTGIDLLKKLRKYSGIIYAIYKGRLKNTYCSANNRMMLSDELNDLRYRIDNDHESTRNVDRSCLRRNGRYELTVFKDSAWMMGCPIEFRIPSRVSSVHMLMRRYELFYELMDTAVNHEGTTFKAFIRKVRPIIMSMYDGNSEKVSEVLKLSESFQSYIDTGILTDDIRRYIS